MKRGNSLGGAPLRGSDAKMQSWWHCFFGTISNNAIVQKNCGSKTWNSLGRAAYREGAALKCRACGTGFSGQTPAGQSNMHGKKVVAGEFFSARGGRRWIGAWPGLARSMEQH